MVYHDAEKLYWTRHTTTQQTHSWYKVHGNCALFAFDFAVQRTSHSLLTTACSSDAPAYHHTLSQYRTLHRQTAPYAMSVPDTVHRARRQPRTLCQYRTRGSAGVGR
eukprot:2788865-Rhodomonas_salina.1